MATILFGISYLRSEEQIADIKAAYRQLAKKYHPDMDPGDLATLDKFREACEAYDIIRQEIGRAGSQTWSPNPLKGERWGFSSAHKQRGQTLRRTWRSNCSELLGR